MNKLIKYFVAVSLFSISLFSLRSQEVLTGLVANKPIARAAAQTSTPLLRSVVQLPFVDDFSNYTGYPNPALWKDRFAYINRSFALQPPTIGVATLDALDDKGMIYKNADPDGFDADILTSQPVCLNYDAVHNRPITSSDSLYLSFYYQPAGGTVSGLEWERLGNRPETQDSLILEFGYATGNTIVIGYEFCDYYIDDSSFYSPGDTLQNPYIPNKPYIFDSYGYPGDLVLLPCDSIMGDEMHWEHIWSTPGESLDNWLAENPLQYFKQVLIPVDTPWLIGNFQFRFRNRASLEDNGIVGWASNVDQWNIDYVRLDMNRSYGDTCPNDVAFVASTTSILKKYHSMPWTQYRDSDLGTEFSNQLVNLSNVQKNVQYTYELTKAVGDEYQVLATMPLNSENAHPYYPDGLHDVQAHTSPEFMFHDLPGDSADSATFIVTHIFREEGAGDRRSCNDTCILLQKFNNFYAYDDGTAEAGYSILSTMSCPESCLAMKFTLAHPDTLRAVRMWFNSVLEDANFAEFNLMVWNANGNEPGDVLYEQPACLPAHAERFEDFVEYRWTDTFNLPVVSGTVFIGFSQNNSVQLNLGFDQNTDSREFFVYKTADRWCESFFKGTPMIRPVFGKPLPDIGSSIAEENHITDFLLYPNPTETSLQVSLPENQTISSYRIFDTFGKMIAQRTVHSSHTRIDVADYAPGLYLLQILDGNNHISTQKFIKK